MSNSNHDEATLAAIRPLREAGFAVHWLKPRSKAPAGGEGWSEAPVASIEQLLASHRPGYNAGLRTGEPSRLDSGDYVHVFDLDIRIPDLADEAWEAFRALLPDVDLDSLPSVRSGSGGESRHRYFVTDRPFYGKKLAVSEGKHRDAAGKWHYDWEIDLFGTGRQVAIPPSIHPDTGLPYVWEREFDFDDLAFGGGPFIPSSVIESLGVAETSEFECERRAPLDFKPGQLEGDLDVLPVERWDNRDDWVMIGQALHHQFGGSDEGFELWARFSAKSEKCDKDFRKANLRRWRGFGRNRKTVTMGTIRQWARDARLQEMIKDLPDDLDDLDDDTDSDDDGGFDSLMDAPAAASDDDDEAVFSKGLEENGSALDWKSLLAINKNDDGFVANLHNLELILKNDPRLAGLAQINEFTQETVQRTRPGMKGKARRNQAKPTRELTGRVWDVEDTLNGELWSDDRDFAIRTIIEAPRTQGGYSIKISDRDLRAAIVLAANDHAFHPIREYLDGLKWDGEQRVERLWVDYVHATDDCYHRDVARLMMVAAVTRIFEPGHKFDYATILEGLQGKRKSTLIEILGRKWFAELDGDFHDQKQMVELMQGAWIMEIPELTGFSRSDVRSIKAFISRKKDRVRLAYARRAGQFPRQCVFVGSTNDREYLKDDTGGRRFWPVLCIFGPDEEIDTDKLEANVDQLWAEAVAIYRSMRAEKPRGTLPLYLADRESRAIAARLQESRRVESPDDVMAGKIAEWLDMPLSTGSIDDDLDADGKPIYRNEVCTIMIWVECLGKDEASFKTVEQGSVNRALSKVPGWGPAGSHRFARYGKQRVFSRDGLDGYLARKGLK